MNSARRGLIVLFLAAIPCSAQTTADVPHRLGSNPRDDWEVATLNGRRAGYVHLTSEEIAAPSGVKVIRFTRELKLSVRRTEGIAELRYVTVTDELPSGTVVGTFMAQVIDNQVTQRVRGLVRGPSLELSAAGSQGAFTKAIPWDGSVLGQLGEIEWLASAKPKLGDRLKYRRFEPMANVVMNVRVKVEGTEVVRSQHCARISMLPDAVAGVQMPGLVVWVDGQFQAVRTSTHMPGLGQLVTERGTKAEATATVGREELPSTQELGTIAVERPKGQPLTASAVVYRITMRNDLDPATAFARDTRQSAKRVEGDAVLLSVSATPRIATNDAEPGDEFLSANHMMSSGDERVRWCARSATGSEADPRRKAQLIVGWVNRNMRARKNTGAIVPAAQVAGTLEGDCKDYAVLTAAMFRAAGMPSRTAMGLLYVDAPHSARPYLGFHMWAEAWIDGRWVPLDATRTNGAVGVGHLKICDHSWHAVQSMTPLLPVTRVTAAQPAVEIVEIVY